MKLLILYTKNRNEIFNKKSALGSYINYLGRLLSQNGFEVYLNGENINEVDEREIEIPISANKLIFIKKMIPKVFKRWLNERRQLKNIENFKNELLTSNSNYDLILEYYNMGSDVGLELAKHQNIPYYIFYDGPILDEYEIFNHSKPFFYNKIIKRQKDSFSYAKRIVAQSNPMKNYVVKNIINSPEKIMIHQNVDFTKFDVLQGEKNFNTDNLKIGFIGSFLPWHQVDLLINAFAYIRNKGIEAELFLIGDGMEKQKIEGLVNQLPKNIKNNIVFTGFVNGEHLFNYKKMLDIGVMPGSNWYGAPLKIFEYGAMKMACIAPDTPTIKDLFPKNEVVFFKWKNQDSLNEVLFNLCQGKPKLEDCSQVLHQKIMDKYSANNTVEFYLELFNKN
jgi:glycosyltransferase involved in cell wall biosynthesis